MSGVALLESPAMSYQVLALKWRPKSFGTLIGQEHVVRALTHALATGRLHHAWLFTGTRGVGKTTISRILAKALNCETGITPEPCGVCDACRAIDADRFPDYVEMDAASNRGVDDMAALLDKAVYAPVQGRYKVYMIDEVHMLTGHAFNAMLKTLEEPPEHVKFILATTDPQKIPVTVLSRCLQFNLKQMPPSLIIDHLAHILQVEEVPFEPGALRHLAKAASGSMRDALSLLDQSIAHGAGKIAEEQVTDMLGTVGDDHLYAVLDALVAGDVLALLAVADAMEARSLSFEAALQALATLVHRIALAQYAPTAIADELERARNVSYAAAFDAEFLQLVYQIVIHGRDELALAPDEYTGFSMTLLRLHAFRPEASAALGSAGVAPAGSGQAKAMGSGMVPVAPTGAPSVTQHSDASAASSRRVAGAAPATAEPVPRPAEVGVASAAARARAPATTSPAPALSTVTEKPAQPPAPSGDHDVPPWEDLPAEAYAYHSDVPATHSDALAADDVGSVPAVTDRATSALQVEAPARAAHKPPSTPAGSTDAAALLAMGDWRGLIRVLELGGMVRELAQHCEWVDFNGAELQLRLSSAHRHLLDMNRNALDRLQDQIGSACAQLVRVHIVIGDIAGETPAARDEIERQLHHADAVAALEADPFVRELIERFDATLAESSVKPR